jgi:DNA-binding MarR family transcriptional regulator
MLASQDSLLGSLALQTTSVAAHLRVVLTRTARRLRQQAGTDLSPSQTATLATIERRGPLTPSEVAACERIQRPTATRVIARLEEAGLVERAADPTDGRSSLLTITAEGRDLLEQGRTRKDLFLAQRLETLEPDEVATLERAAAILERVLES